MSKFQMNCGYCGRKCDMKKDYCIPQDGVYVCKSCYGWQAKITDLEAKLAEKEEKQERTNKVVEQFQQRVKYFAEKDNQDKIELLEKVKEDAKHYGYEFSKSMHEYIDTLIKEIKGE